MSFVLAFLLLVGAAPAQTVPENNPYTSPADLARGAQIYNGSCQGCHGPRGEGGKGANLAQPRLANAPTDRALFRIIRFGIPGTEMPSVWLMTDRETWQVAAFVRSLGAVEPGVVAGNAKRGEEVVETKANCARCHIIGGSGGRMGPELTDIGLRRSASYLRAALVDPEAAVPANYMQLRLRTRDGKQLSGVRLNEDSFTIQIRDFRDNLHSFYKDELIELQYDRGRSAMPSYRGTLTGAELDDVVAYLVTLRGTS
jgi:cytochrome c oxidase cbb3-type subunit III